MEAEEDTTLFLLWQQNFEHKVNSIWRPKLHNLAAATFIEILKTYFFQRNYFLGVKNKLYPSWKHTPSTKKNWWKIYQNRKALIYAFKTQTVYKNEDDSFYS